MMMRENYDNLLKSNDRPVQWEYPLGMNYQKEVTRFRQFVLELERRLGKELEVETESLIQDASFHSQVSLGSAYLRFSNFGNMLATTNDDAIAPSTLEEIKDLAIKNGYTFVPHDLLEEPYTGKNPGVTGIRDWWTRYFDWV